MTNDRDRQRRGAAEEVAPREVEPGTHSSDPASIAAKQPGAVDENHPADVISQAGMQGIDTPHAQPNVLQRQNVIVPGDHVHPQTAGEDLIDDEALAGKTVEQIRGNATT